MPYAEYWLLSVEYCLIVRQYSTLVTFMTCVFELLQLTERQSKRLVTVLISHNDDKF